MGTEFGEVGSVRLAFDGHWTIGMLLGGKRHGLCTGHNPGHLRAKLQQRPCLAAAARCRKTSRSGARFLLEGFVYTLQEYIVVDVTVGAFSTIGCKLSVLLKGIGAEKTRIVERARQAEWQAKMC